MVVTPRLERRLAWLPGLALRVVSKSGGIILLLTHLLIEVSVLLEPVSVHPLPFHLHQVIDGVKLPLADEVCLLLALVLSQSIFIVEKNGLVVRPKVLDLLLLI